MWHRKISQIGSTESALVRSHRRRRHRHGVRHRSRAVGKQERRRGRFLSVPHGYEFGRFHFGSEQSFERFVSGWKFRGDVRHVLGLVCYRGSMKIMEVESRFDKVETFVQEIHRFGFRNTWSDLSHNLFYFLDFKKVNDCKNKKNLPLLRLNPCLYKKR